MRFTWDEKKRQINIRKHAIDFTELTTVFQKPMIVKIDDREDYGETRLIALGDMTGTIVILVYTESKNTVRLISARRATKNETNTYFKKIYGEQ